MRLLIPLLLAALLGPAMAADYNVGERLTPRKTTAALNYREIQWEDLVPKGWDPMAALKGLNMSKLKDSDPKAIEALEKLKTAWAEAPVEPSLDGKRIKLAGFVIPLERKGDAVLELLLVPYFGPCRAKKAGGRHKDDGYLLGQRHTQPAAWRQQPGYLWLPNDWRTT
jgi:hypothetical protein